MPTPGIQGPVETTTAKGQPGGYCDLGGDGQVPAIRLGNAATPAAVAAEAAQARAAEAALTATVAALGAKPWAPGIAFVAEAVVLVGAGMWQAPTGGAPARAAFTPGDWLHLGDIATPIGTTAGTVAAGNDARIVAASTYQSRTDTFTASQIVVAPSWATTADYDIISGANGGAGGASTNSSAILQAPGAAASAGTRQIGTIPVIGGTTYPVVVGASGLGGTGGAAGGNPGGNPTGGGTSSFGPIRAVSSFGLALGGPASSSALPSNMMWHYNSSGTSSSVPGASGGNNGLYPEAPMMGLYGASLGGAASATNGGGAAVPPDSNADSFSFPGTNGGSATTSGEPTPPTTSYGCGGCGGAGGALGGAGAAGGNGGPGKVTITWRSQ